MSSSRTKSEARRLAIFLQGDAALRAQTGNEIGGYVCPLCGHKINPGRLIEVQAKDISGLYVAENVTHEGDTFEQNWYAKIDAVRPAG